MGLKKTSQCGRSETELDKIEVPWITLERRCGAREERVGRDREGRGGN